MRKGTIIILVLLLLIAGMAYAIITPRLKATSVSSAGTEIPVAANEANIRTARLAQAWDSVRFGTIYYYYVDGKPEGSDPSTTNIVAMPGVTEKEAIKTVQESLKNGTYRIIALRTLHGEELTSCPYVLNEIVRDSEFG